jgi:hypothetical protein
LGKTSEALATLAKLAPLAAPSIAEAAPNQALQLVAAELAAVHNREVAPALPEAHTETHADARRPAALLRHMGANGETPTQYVEDGRAAPGPAAPGKTPSS